MNPASCPITGLHIHELAPPPMPVWWSTTLYSIHNAPSTILCTDRCVAERLIVLLDRHGLDDTPIETLPPLVTTQPARRRWWQRTRRHTT